MGSGADESDDDPQSIFKNFDVLGKNVDKPAVLVFGGSKFMGKAFVEDALAQQARVCVVNRGRTYWGSDDPSDGKTARVVADREDTEVFADRLREATRRLGGSWDLIADFSAFDRGDVKASLAGLGSKFKLYVYISSDSVYEVSTWASEKWRPKPGLGDQTCVAEDAGVRPSDKDVARKLNKGDSYGHGKLEGEEALAEALPDGCRCIFLRLPDVIGPFDGTYRLWAYWHWLRSGEAGGPPPQIQSYKRKKSQDVPIEPALAVVYSRDVARFIASLLKSPPPPDAGPCDAVNLGCKQQLQLSVLLEHLAAVSGCPRKRPRFAPVKGPKSYLPSVDRPWPLNLDRASKLYAFEPTPLDEVLQTCATFFEDGCKRFPHEATKAAQKLPEEAADIALKLAGLDRLSKSP